MFVTAWLHPQQDRGRSTSQGDWTAFQSMASISARRLAKELREIEAEGCPVGKRLLPASNCLVRVKRLKRRARTNIHSRCYLGINLVEANDFSKWLFTIEVMGESLYQVHVFCPHSPR